MQSGMLGNTTENAGWRQQQRTIMIGENYNKCYLSNAQKNFCRLIIWLKNKNYIHGIYFLGHNLV